MGVVTDYEQFAGLGRVAVVDLESPHLASHFAERAKDSLANSLAGAFETSADAVSNFANVFTYNLGLDYYTKYAQDVNRVTTDQTLAVSKQYLVPANMVVVAVGDRKVIEPSLAKLNVGKVEIRDAEGRPSK